MFHFIEFSIYRFSLLSSSLFLSSLFLQFPFLQFVQSSTSSKALEAVTGGSGIFVKPCRSLLISFFFSLSIGFCAFAFFILDLFLSMATIDFAFAFAISRRVTAFSLLIRTILSPSSTFILTGRAASVSSSLVVLSSSPRRLSLGITVTWLWFASRVGIYKTKLKTQFMISLRNQAYSFSNH